MNIRPQATRESRECYSVKSGPSSRSETTASSNVKLHSEGLQRDREAQTDQFFSLGIPANPSPATPSELYAEQFAEGLLASPESPARLHLEGLKKDHEAQANQSLSRDLSANSSPARPSELLAEQFADGLLAGPRSSAELHLEGLQKDYEGHSTGYLSRVDFSSFPILQTGPKEIGWQVSDHLFQVR